jgi:tRNA pseudouridine55 synthase
MKSGYLLIDKEVNWTSFDVVKKTQNILKTKKVGHVGTLDPFATGLMILLVGKATKINEYISGLNKEYIVTSQFGFATDSGDITGNITFEEKPNIVSFNDLQNGMPDILNIKSQKPNKFSAIKINGQKAYNMARKGLDFEMPEREITIENIEFMDIDFPKFTWKVTVSKGTYIRTLTEQIGVLFGNLATTIELKRTKIGNLQLEDSIKIEQVSETSVKKGYDDLLSSLPKISLDINQKAKFLNGVVQPIQPHENSIVNALIRVYYENIFLGLGKLYPDPQSANYVLKIEKVLYEHS